ncbi:MAG: hypothetical protein M1832_000221 [Thelocarpon impressellum]|nr:MAG: hypothetical protein M1832_000221 [Thelocarpon impressellum]
MANLQPSHEKPFLSSAMTRVRGWVGVADCIRMMPTHNIRYTTQQLIDIVDEGQRNRAVLAWEENEKSQLNFVAVASTLVASVVTGSIAWTQTASTHWMVLVLWYGALLMSLWCVIIAFHVGILFSAFDIHADRAGALLHMLRRPGEAAPRDHHLWVLQVPITLFSWGVISYIVGLAVLVLRPLWTAAWGRESWVAVFVLVYGLVTLIIYLIVGSTIYGRLLPDLASYTNTKFP